MWCVERPGSHPDRSRLRFRFSFRVLHHIRWVRKARVSFWPFEKPDGSTIAEIYPTLFRKAATDSLVKLRSVQELNDALAALGSDAMPPSTESLSDHETDALISAAGMRCVAEKRTTWAHPELTSHQVQREGWIFGVAEAEG